ncbi:MAG TPA: CoA ester lyase [Glaciibacter sp.]|nr:CoA ester lyase [Glaciibacter sp.]
MKIHRPSTPLLTGLYVPGDRPDRFDKAVATGAQLIILDLEDAVAADRKSVARSAVGEWLTAQAAASGGSGLAGGPVIQVRVNAGEPLDLALLAGIDGTFEVRVPKAEDGSSIDAIASAVPGRPITAIVETALGVENAAAIALHPAVTRLGIGEADLSSDLGTNAPAAIDYARVRLLFAARAAGLPAPMLSVFPDIRNLDALRADTQRGRELGWVGRVAIHPSQLSVIAEVFQPRPEEQEWARNVLAATAGGGVTTLASGEMVDAAMVKRARAILELAGIPDSENRTGDADEALGRGHS